MKAFIIIAALVVALNASVPNLGSSECTWGPSYWCKNLTSAASCQATKYCIKNDWIHRQLSPDNSSICETCQRIVKEVREQLQNSLSETKVIVEQKCRDFVLDFVIEPCLEIADKIIDLVDTLASDLDPQVVCSVAGFCNNPKLLELLKAEEDMQKN